MTDSTNDNKNIIGWKDTPQGLEYYKTYHERRISFKNARLVLDQNPRKGQCELCGKKLGDGYFGARGKIKIVERTHIHHLKYHEDNILKDTIEVCVSCHIKESWKLKQLNPIRRIPLDRQCAACDSKTTRIPTSGWPQWKYHYNAWMCSNCYSRYVSSPIQRDKIKKIKALDQ